MPTNNAPAAACEHDYSTAERTCARCGAPKPVQAAEPDVACVFCGTTASLDAAVEAGWEPYFWYTGSDGDEHACDRPACPGCTGKHLEADPQDRGDGLQLCAGDDHQEALLRGLAGAA